MDMGIHAIDLLRFVLADEVEAVGSFHDHLVYDCEAETVRSSTFAFGGGRWGRSVSAGSSYGRNALELLQRHGGDHLRAIGCHECRTRFGSDPSGRVWTEYAAPNVDCFRTEIEQFIASLAPEGESPCPALMDART